jgi:TfoX/Sxy family transcriptional regulator of competence genes
MAFNDELASRIRQTFETINIPELSEKKMFGGVAFLYKGKMTVGLIKDDLMVRVLESEIEEVFKNPAVREMDFTKRPMKEFIYVDPAGYETEEQLMSWINYGLAHAQTKVN